MDFDPDHNSLNHRNAKKYNEDEDGGIDSPVDESLYSLFNLPKSATVEEIRDRYKSLAVSLHPDKVRDESHKETMAAKFAQVKRAYEILTDPSKRAIYDLFGEDGLKTKWDVGSKYKTEEELRNEYARLARAAKLHDAENIVRSQGELVCAVNATSLTIPGLGLEEKVAGVTQVQLGLKHKFDTDISDRTRFTLTSRLLSMRGRAGGNVFGTVKHQFSPRLQLEATSGLLEPRTVVSKATFEVNEATTLRAESTIILANALQDVPRLTITGQRLLDPTLTGVISFTTPTLTSPSALAVSLSSTGGLVTTVELSPAKLQAREQLSAEYGVRVGGKEGVLLSASAATGLNQGGLGMVVEVNGTAKLAEATTVRVGVGAALPGGISLKIYLNRLGQRIIIPIQLSREFDLNLALYTAVIPSISAVLVNQYILRPQRQKRAKGRIDALRERQSEMLEEDRKQAEHYIESIREQVKRKIETEKGSDGDSPSSAP
ncbi:DnaJ (Hsp40), sub C, member 11 [Rhizoctonia solani]